jgi:hypothetical protein
MNRIGHFVEAIKQGLDLFISSCVHYVRREANSREATTHFIDFV